MIERAIQADVPFRWVAADTVYGVGMIEMALRRAGKGYVLGVKANHLFRSWAKHEPVGGTAKAIANGLPKTAWKRLSAGEGTKGTRDWAYLELADLDVAEDDETRSGLWTRGPRRPCRASSFAAGSRMAILFSSRPGVQKEPISQPWSGSKGIGGRSRTASRPPKTSWGSRNPRMAWLASTCLTRHAGRDPPSRQRNLAPKNHPDQQRKTTPLIRWSVQERRRVATKLAQRQIKPAYIIAWSTWRRTHQAAAQKSHLKRNMQL